MVEAGLTAERPAVRLRRWAGILSAFFTAQGLVQLAGVAAGILLVRTLPVREFALYTLALSVTTFFTFLSDLGSTGSLVHFFHRAAREGEEFSPYLAAVLSLRRLGFLAGAAAVAVAFPRAALSKGYGSTEIALILLVLIGTVWFQISAAVRLLALRLADRYGVSYRAEVTGAVLRLLLTGALVIAGLLRAWIGMLASALGTAATALLAARGGEVPRPAGETDLRPYRRRVLRYLLPTLPSALYFSIQSPLVVWLAATFGATRNIAEVGALTRLGMVVSLFSSLSGVVFLPRLARITDERAWRIRYAQFGGALAAIALALFAAAAFFPGALLWILGEKYSGLHRELVLVVAGAGLTLLDGYAVGANLARSWTRWQGLAMLSLAGVQAVLVAALPLSTTPGVLTFNLLSSAAALASQLAVAAVGFTRPQWVEWK